MKPRGGNRGVYHFQGMPSQERIRNSVREMKKVQKVRCQECGVYCVSSWIDGQWMWKHIVWMGHTPVMRSSVGVEK